MDSISQLIAELQAPEAGKRERAAFAIGTLADPRALEPLLAYLHDPAWQDPPAVDPFSTYQTYQYFDPYYEAFGEYDVPVLVREAVVDALGEIGTPAVFEPLVDLLRNAEWNVQAKAAEALGEIGDRRAVEPLITALTYTSRVAERAEIALGKLGDPRAVEPLLKRLPGEYTARALGKLGDLRAVPPLLEQATFKNYRLDTWLIRTAALDVLSHLGAKEALDTVFHCTEDEHEQVRAAAFSALGHLSKGDSRSAEFLIDRIRDGEEAQRAAIIALGTVGGERALQFLTTLIQVGSRTERRASIIALGRMGDTRAVPLLLPLLQEDHPKADVAEALGMLHAVEAVEKILPLLHDDRGDTCARAAHALGKLGDQRAVEPLLELVRRYNARQLHKLGFSQDLLANCACALGQLGDRRALAPLRTALAQVDVRNRSNRYVYRIISRAIVQLEM